MRMRDPCSVAFILRLSSALDVSVSYGFGAPLIPFSAKLFPVLHVHQTTMFEQMRQRVLYLRQEAHLVLHLRSFHFTYTLTTNTERAALLSSLREERGNRTLSCITLLFANKFIFELLTEGEGTSRRNTSRVSLPDRI